MNANGRTGRRSPRPSRGSATTSPLAPGETCDREVGSLVACLEALDLPEGTLLTLDREERLEVRGRRVVLRPVWQFLLGG